MSRAAVLSAISALCCCAWPAVADDFQLACHPFSLPREARPIDGKCGSGGSAAHGPNTPENRAKEAQNRRKNALCRQEAPVTPVTLTMADFMALQTQAQHQGIQFGAEGSGGDRKEHLPPDRTRLDSQHFRTVHGRPVGEGTWVQIVGFMNEPHPGGKEDVNCESTDNSDKDVHINLVGSAAPWLPAKTDPSKDEKEAIRNAALCKGIVAETIPHFRPDLFEASPLRSVAKQEFPVLISGQLFFDASHFPCEGDVPH